MDKRTLLAIAISMGVLLLWWQLFPPTPPPQTSKPAATGASGQSAPAAPGAQQATTPAGTPAQAASPGAPRPAEQKVVLDGDRAKFVLSTWGGSLREVVLEDERFLRDRNDPTSGAQIIGTKTPETAPLLTTFPKGTFAGGAAAFTVSQQSADTVVFRAENDKVAVEKRYKLAGPFQLTLDVTLQNKGTAPLDEGMALHLYGWQDPDKQGSGFWDITSAIVTTMVCSANEDIERHTVESLVSEPKNFVGQGAAVRWAAADDKYFAVAAVPHPESSAGERRCGQRAIDPLTGEAFLSFASKSIPAQGKQTTSFTIFAGPKYTDILDGVDPGGQEVELDKVVDVSLAVLSKPLLTLLKTFHGWAGNWGLAIIMLTLFVKLLTFYPQHRAMMSGKKMQRLAPKMAELKKKYENDRQRLGVESMALYKQEGVSPLGGCLPTLITMPIWIALFSTLQYAVELHRAPFFGYIKDLSYRDPYFITPLLVGAIMFLQMRMSPAGADPQQQKMMAVMMPIMFTAFSLFLPAGLAIYTLTNSLLAILHQVWVNRLDAQMAAAPVPLPASAKPRAKTR